MQPNRSIRALVFDLDGTLLNSQKKVTERTQQALIQCAEMGLHLFIATARPLRSVKALIPFNTLRLMSAVYYNGAYSRDINGETFSRTILLLYQQKLLILFAGWAKETRCPSSLRTPFTRSQTRFTSKIASICLFHRLLSHLKG